MHRFYYISTPSDSSDEEMSDVEEKQWEVDKALAKESTADTVEKQMPAATIENLNRFLLQYQNLYAPLNALSTDHAATYRFVTKQFQVCLKALEQLTKREQSLTKDQKEKNKKVFVTKLRDTLRELKILEGQKETALNMVRLREEYLNHVSETRFRSDSLWRLIIDFCAREGHLDIGQSLLDKLKDDTIELDISKGDSSVRKYIQFGDTISLNVYHSEKDILNDLDKCRCEIALKWCEENKSLLKKVGSTLQFELHLQEYLELVRKEKLMEAITYARQHFDGTLGDNLMKVKQAMGSLAFGPNTQIQPYADLFSYKRWLFLKETFKKDNRKIHSLTSHTELLLYMQAGISALNTPLQVDRTNRDDPLIHPAMKELAKDLPYSFHDQSLLKCSISGDVINDSNPPVSLPNGNVYGLNTINMLSESNGIFQDPKTMEEFSLDEIKKCFIMNSW